jgi:hypothetical protein
LVAVIARIGEFYRTRDDLSPPPAAHAPLVRVQLVESGDGSPPRAAPSTRT